MDGSTLGELQFAGRWKSPQSLAAYVQESMAHLVWLAMPAPQQRALECIEADTAHVWQAPPTVPRTAVCAQASPWPRRSTPSRMQRSTAPASSTEPEAS